MIMNFYGECQFMNLMSCTYVCYVNKGFVVGDIADSLGSVTLVMDRSSPEACTSLLQINKPSFVPSVSITTRPYQSTKNLGALETDRRCAHGIRDR